MTTIILKSKNGQISDRQQFSLQECQFTRELSLSLEPEFLQQRADKKINLHIDFVKKTQNQIQLDIQIDTGIKCLLTDKISLFHLPQIQQTDSSDTDYQDQIDEEFNHYQQYFIAAGFGCSLSYTHKQYSRPTLDECKDILQCVDYASLFLKNNYFIIKKLIKFQTQVIEINFKIIILKNYNPYPFQNNLTKKIVFNNSDNLSQKMVFEKQQYYQYLEEQENFFDTKDHLNQSQKTPKDPKAQSIAENILKPIVNKSTKPKSDIPYQQKQEKNQFNQYFGKFISHFKTQNQPLRVAEQKQSNQQSEISRKSERIKKSENKENIMFQNDILLPMSKTQKGQDKVSESNQKTNVSYVSRSFQNNFIQDQETTITSNETEIFEENQNNEQRDKSVFSQLNSSYQPQKKGDKKNVVKNFAKGFKQFINQDSNETFIRQIIKDQFDSIQEFRQQFHCFLINHKFNNSLIKYLLQDQRFSLVWRYFINNIAYRWLMENSKVQDKQTHNEVLQTYKKAGENIDDLDDLKLIVCLKNRSKGAKLKQKTISKKKIF